MNIQIFGTAACRNTQKAQRWFKERRIPFQFVNLKEKEMSPKEFNSVLNAVGGIENMIDTESKNYSSIAYLTDDDVFDKLFSTQSLLKTPVVRNGQLATCGYNPEVWKDWK